MFFPYVSHEVTGPMKQRTAHGQAVEYSMILKVEYIHTHTKQKHGQKLYNTILYVMGTSKFRQIPIANLSHVNPSLGKPQKRIQYFFDFMEEFDTLFDIAESGFLQNNRYL